MKILVTGGAGFIGSHLVKRLLSQGHEVTVVDDFSGGTEHNLPEEGLGIYRCSINSIKLDWIFEQNKPDKVYQVAAYAAEGLSSFIRNFNYQNNVLGSANIINACIKYDVQELIFLSSVAVYGKANGIGKLKEIDYCTPMDPYGNAKLCVERDIQIAHDQHGLTYKIFRPHNVIGTHQNRLDPYRNVVGIFISNLLQGKPLPIFGDGTQQRQFTPVEYVVEGLVSDLLPSNEIYNIGSNKSYPILDVATLLVDLFNLRFHSGFGDDLLSFKAARHEAHHPICDHFKIQKYLGACKYDLAEELLKIINWAKTDPGFKSVLPKIELEKGLPESWKHLI